MRRPSSLYARVQISYSYQSTLKAWAPATCIPNIHEKRRKTKTLSNLAEGWQQGLKPIEVTDKLGATLVRYSYFKVSLERKWKSEIQLRDVHLEHPEDPHHANQPQDLANASHHHRVLHVTIVLRFGANIVQGVPSLKKTTNRICWKWLWFIEPVTWRHELKYFGLGWLTWVPRKP